jgi:hypothetical protein
MAFPVLLLASLLSGCVTPQSGQGGYGGYGSPGAMGVQGDWRCSNQFYVQGLNARVAQMNVNDQSWWRAAQEYDHLKAVCGWGG